MSKKGKNKRRASVQNDNGMQNYTTSGGAIVRHHNGYNNLAMNSIVDRSQVPASAQRRMRPVTGSRKVTGDGFAGRMPVGASVDIRYSMPGFYQPLFQAQNMLLPRDRRERNEWCRHFYRTEPIISTALDIHTEFPISDINNMCSDPGIKKFYDYMAFEKLDIVNFLLSLGLEYWKIGDAFPFGQFNESEGIWEQFTLLNPDFVNVVGSIFGGEQQIELIPDDTTAAIVAGGPTGEFGELYKRFPQEILMQVKQGRNILLDNRLVTHIAHKASHYEQWGTPLMMRCFKTLIYKDKLRQAQDAIANRHIFPIRVAKIGTPGEPMPTNEDIEGFRDLLLALDDDPSRFIVYHYGLSFEYVGSNGHILPLNTEFDFINNELLMGMCITQNLLNGDGSQFTNSAPGFEALAHRYMAYRLRLESWIRNKVYKPIAEVQRFYRPLNGTIATRYMTSKEITRAAAAKELELVIPKIVWQQQDLTSNQSVMSFIQTLNNKGMVSMTTILPLLSLDPETEKRNLERERGTVFDPNAPKTGPLPKDGIDKSLGVDDGSTVREFAPKLEDGNGAIIEEVGGPPDNRPAPPPRPEPGTAPTRGNNPEDFGFPGEAEVGFDNFFVRHGKAAPPMDFKRSELLA